MADQLHTSDDAQFGKMAQEKQEQADALEAKGVGPIAEPEGEGQDPRPRAASKASDGARPATDA